MGREHRIRNRGDSRPFVADDKQDSDVFDEIQEGHQGGFARTENEDSSCGHILLLHRAHHIARADLVDDNPPYFRFLHPYKRHQPHFHSPQKGKIS